MIPLYSWEPWQNNGIAKHACGWSLRGTRALYCPQKHKEVPQRRKWALFIVSFLLVAQPIITYAFVLIPSNENIMKYFSLSGLIPIKNFWRIWGFLTF